VSETDGYPWATGVKPRRAMVRRRRIRVLGFTHPTGGEDRMIWLLVLLVVLLAVGGGIAVSKFLFFLLLAALVLALLGAFSGRSTA
jgi:hypothetical protein